jgi:D-alanyl-D-alanine carboxypeptidase (penicillin-binding protein 5/6)
MVCVSLLVSAWLPAADSQQEASAFVVMNAVSGRVLMQRAAHQKMYPASTTKIATLAYVVSTAGLDLNQQLVVPAEAVRAVSVGEKSRDNFSKYPAYILEAGASSMAGFKAGEVIRLQDALHGAMLCSGNDAANTLAYYWGKGSIDVCVEGINRLVEAIGCQNTRFVNPHGLHHPCHVSTAYDLALIARYAMQTPLFRSIVKTTTYTKECTNKQPAVTWQQTNKLLIQGPYHCERATGIKTGYTGLAQHCLVASGETADRSIIVVLLHCPDRKHMFLAAKKLLERFLSEEKVHHTVVEKGSVQLKREIEGQKAPLALTSPRECAVAFYPSEQPELRAVVEWKELRFPVEPGHEIGVVHVFADDHEVDAVPLLASEHRDTTWSQRWLSARSALKENRGGVVVAVLILGALIGFASFFRSASRRGYPR